MPAKYPYNMLLYFGLALEEELWRMPAPPWSGMFWVGPQGLLNVLESHLGLAGAQPLDEFLRIEQYRQLLSAHLSEHPDAFFAESFAADPLATATALLAYRDELLLAGWDFALSGDEPPRVRVLAELETALRIGVEEGKAFSPGWADRFSAVLSVLSTRRHPVQEIKIVEPPELLPPHFRRLLAALEKTGVQLTWLPQIQPSDADTDLARFQRVLAGQGAGKTELRGDGSLLLARTRRDRDLAAWAATLLRRNPDFRPLCYISDRSRSLDNALIQEGLPSLGLLSASQARPTLQVLKLAAGFLWNPVDPFKLMEFVSLAVKPVEDGLAAAIAESLAQT
ncbi:MAG TPA: hypothetical protein PLI34_11160, partial [Saprospiraceae bacterium]|nr:hypothetical protein [Saprospiraceae bacterium]